MKKTGYFLVLLLVASLISYESFAQGDAITKGDVIVDLGVGFVGGVNTSYHGSTTNWSSNNSTNKIQLPTLSVSVQKAFWNDITIGGQVAFNIYGSEYDLKKNDGYYQHSKYSQSNVYILGRGEYHFNRLIDWDSKYDLYAGVLAGTRITSAHESDVYDGWGTAGQPGVYRNDYDNASYLDIGPSVSLMGGFRYFFKKNMAVYGEVGYGITALRVGLAWKL